MARAEPPACFAERTVLWAAPFLDEKGDVFGGIRAGHAVRVIDDFIGSQGEQALIETDKPMRVRALVSRRQLLAFTQHEIELSPGFSRWVTGAPVTIGKIEGDAPRLFHADPHVPGRKPPSTVAPCTVVAGAPTKIIRVDRCQGAWPAIDAVTHGSRRVFWKSAVPLRALIGKGQTTIPGDEWVYLVEKRKSDVVVEYRHWLGHTVYIGKAPSRGMRYVPSNLGRGVGHLCCPGVLFSKPRIDVRQGRVQVVTTPSPVQSTVQGPVVATFDAGQQVRVLEERDDMSFVVYRWPNWAEDTFTFQIHGWVATRTLRDPLDDEAR